MSVSPTVPDSLNTYALGALGSYVGSLSSGDVLMAVSGIMVFARFVYDTVRFIHYLKDRKAPK